VARKLGNLHARCFLTGGTSIPLYINTELAEPPRVTYDIDVVIEVSSGTEFRSQIETQLRVGGFEHDMTPGAPICRWRFASPLVDVMPVDEGVLGFSNPWYKAGLSSLMEARISDQCTWRILTPPFALASKFAAFWERGAADPRMSHNLEDIVTLLNGREQIVEDVLKAPRPCRDYLVECFGKILKEERLEDSIESHVFPDSLASERLMTVKRKIREFSVSPD
jgi:hypothetical protein